MPNLPLFAQPTMHRWGAWSAALALALCAQTAALGSSLTFSLNNWQLVCDNTRTCRAAGFSVDGAANPVSVLLTRKAGPREAVHAQVMIGNYGPDGAAVPLPSILKLSMRVNGRAAGQTIIHTNRTMTADLSAAQVNTLLAALPRPSTIEWRAGAERWALSDKGSTAVLLKMDAFQGRIGTIGALIKKGPGSDDRVLPPLTVPEVMTSAPAKPQPGDAHLVERFGGTLRNALVASVKKSNYCPMLTEPEEDAVVELALNRLSDEKFLISVPCWSGAYNFGTGYWVVNERPPFNPVLVTDSGSGYRDGSIFASQKGRGLGDCWSTDSWEWNGKQFIHTESSSTGLCRLIAAGGSWDLPTIVTQAYRRSTSKRAEHRYRK